MQRTPLLTILIFLYIYIPSFPVQAATGNMPSSPPAQVIDNSSMNVPSEQDMEKILKVQEVFLRKIKAEHLLRVRKQHVVNTEKAYIEAKSLYHQKRRAKAKSAFAHVEDSMPDYKMTNSFLRVIDNRSVAGLRHRMRRIREMKGTQLVVNLAQQASTIYQQSAVLGNDKNTAPVREKLMRVKEILEKLKREKMAASQQTTQQSRLDQIANEADDYDQEISKLVSSKDYKTARKKYIEFQQAMTNELVQLKKNIIHANKQLEPVKPPNSLLEEKGYRVQEQSLFRQGVDLYRKKEYFEAKSIFDQLASQGDSRAQAYSRKIDHITP